MRIYSAHNLAAVHHAKNLLQAAGIRAVVRNEYLSSAMGDLPPAECQAEVWLLSDHDLQRAHEVLFAKKPLEGGWRCSSCGEAGEPQFTQCWRCGAYRA